MLATSEHDGTINGQGDEEDEILTTRQRIVLDLNYGTPEATEGGQPATTPIDTGNGGMPGAGGQTVREAMTRRLRPILRALTDSGEFRRSTQTIEIPDEGEFVVGEFFVNFAEVTDAHIGCYRGFWGLVVDARRDVSGTLWLNSGGRENMSTLLDQRFIMETYDRFHIEENDDFAGGYVLVLGELRVGPTGKKYVAITDPSRFTLRLAR